jgi:hypothetical protein
MLRPAPATPDPFDRLHQHVRQALALINDVSVTPHPAARLPSRRRSNQIGYALQGAKRELHRLVALLDPK